MFAGVEDTCEKIHHRRLEVVKQFGSQELIVIAIAEAFGFAHQRVYSLALRLAEHLPHHACAKYVKFAMMTAR